MHIYCLKNVRLIPVDFTKYDDMGSYIEDTIKIALQSLFEVGFTLKGCKVRKNKIVISNALFFYKCIQ